jgi:hypothetical protein
VEDWTADLSVRNYFDDLPGTRGRGGPGYPNPTFLKVLEIQESECSSGDKPPVCRRAKASLYHCESG